MWSVVLTSHRQACQGEKYPRSFNTSSISRMVVTDHVVGLAGTVCHLFFLEVAHELVF
jgi:hypothetical protein